MGSVSTVTPGREQSGVAIEVRPDWEKVGTANELNNYIGGGFKFTGPGWYIEKDGAALIVPVEPFTDPWRQTWPAGTLFRYLSYGHNPLASFNAVANAPTRKDRR